MTMIVINKKVILGRIACTDAAYCYRCRPVVCVSVGYLGTIASPIYKSG